MTLHEHILSAALTALLCCPFSMARAQHVTQRFKDEPLRDVIHEVERQTRMSFIYKADAIDESQHVTATFSRTPIKKVLRNILPEGVSFTIKKTPHHPLQICFYRQNREGTVGNKEQQRLYRDRTCGRQQRTANHGCHHLRPESKERHRDRL